MRSYGTRKFDPVKYWARKPYCVICKTKKVVSGNICKSCQEEGGWNSKTVSEEQIKPPLMEEKSKITTQEILRQEASPLIKSLVGYLKDCAVAILRNSSLIDITNTADISFIQAPHDSLELLANGGFELQNKEAFNLIYKITSRPNEFDLILGTLFLKGKVTNQSRKDVSICAPLLYLKLEGKRNEENNSILFTLKEDGVTINQSLISSVVDVKDEDELEVRFQDLYEMQPAWPLTIESLNQFLQNLSNTFTNIFNQDTNFTNFVDFSDVESEEGSLTLCPTSVLIVMPKQEAEGTIVEELNDMFQHLLDKTGVDTLFSENLSGSNELNSGETQSLESTVKKNELEEKWHTLWPIDLSDTQKKVVLSARKNNLTVVSGPPGTGKSYTVEAVIIDHLLAGKRVLFVSRMDKAVEVVTSKLEEMFGEYSVARSGGRNAQRKLAEKLEKLTGANTPVRFTDKKELDEFSKKYAELQAKVEKAEEDFLTKVSYEREWSKVQTLIEEIKGDISNDVDFEVLNLKKEKIVSLKDGVSSADNILKNKSFFLSTWWGQSSLKRIKKKLNLADNISTEELLKILDKKIGENDKIEIESELSKFDEVNELWTEIQNLKKELRKVAQEILQKKLLGSLYSIVNKHSQRKELRDFIQSLKASDVRRKNVFRQKVTTATLLSAFPCWASTTTHLSQILPLEAGIFDLVIFDESRQCDLASALPALYRANRVLIVGDPKQLTHVVFLSKQSEFSAFANNAVPLELQSSYRFSMRSLFDISEDKVEQSSYLMLDEHFRSDPHIISFSNKNFYDGKLRIMTERPILNNKLAIEIDYVKGKRTIGTENPKEIEAIFRHVGELIAEDESVTIGILCPFRDQVNAITRELPKYLNLEQIDKHKIVIGTAHTLQGDEKDVVILSLSISPGFHHGTLSFLEKPNVFNVSITRAKKRLIVTSSVQMSDLPNGLLKNFFIHAESALDQTIPLDRFDSKFEQRVASALQMKGLHVWPQYESAGFHIDLVAGDGKSFIAIECDGPSHFSQENNQNYYDVWRQQILERAGWRFVRISDREWYRDEEKAVEKIINALLTLSK